jgi:hypothetical protein
MTLRSICAVLWVLLGPSRQGGGERWRRRWFVWLCSSAEEATCDRSFEFRRFECRVRRSWIGTRDDWRYECLRLLMYCIDAYAPRGFELLRWYCGFLARSLQKGREARVEDTANICVVREVLAFGWQGSQGCDARVAKFVYSGMQRIQSLALRLDEK